MYPEPTEISIGDTITWIRRDVVAYYENDAGDYDTTDIKASEGWTLKFVAVGQAGVISITAAADADDPDDFKFTATAAVTAAYAAGDYQWQLIATYGTGAATIRYTIALGRVKCLVNTASLAAASDNRTHAKKVLDAVEAILEGRASRDQMAYQIAGRSLQLTPIPDLLKLRAVYKREYEAEKAADEVQAGRKSGRKLYTRFVTPGR